MRKDYPGFCAVCLLCIFLLSEIQLYAASTPPTGKDTITFTNGDTLTGKLTRVLNGTVAFHSDVLGDVTVPLAKVKALHTTGPFAVVEKSLLEKKNHITRRTAAAEVPVGAIAIADDKVKVHAEEVRNFPVKDTADLIDAASFNKEIRGESNFFYGWTGTLTLGASLVNGTNSAQTYTGSVAFVRSIPTATFLPLGSKTTLNLSGTYGLASDPEIISGGNIFQTASISKTDILHGDTEHDKYISPVIFWLVNASADHNFGNGLQLQQAYGGGLGWSLLKNPKNSLDVKADLQYEEQQFYNGLTSGLGTPDENLVGAALNENWARTFAHDIKFNEYVTLSPTFNVVQAYSGVANANFVFPVYKKLNFSLASTDNYLGDPPEGYQRNTFQFTAGVTYTVK